MGLFSFLKRAAPAAPSSRETAAASPAPAPVTPARPPALLREEITDRRNRLCGYRFSCRDRSEHGLFQALAAERIAEFAARRMAVIPLSGATLASPLHRQFAASQAVFLVESRELAPERGLAQLQALRQDGARAALRGLPPVPGSEDLLQACDILFLDLGEVDLPQFHATLDRLHASYPQLQIAVEGVGSWDEQRMCVGWGADYCLGTYLTQPDIADDSGTIDQSRLTALKLLNLLRSDAEVTELAEVAKQDPGITLQLLKWANAPINGQSTVITSLAQAIVVLGRNLLYRWLAVTIFKLGRQLERDAALLEVALRRARFLELVHPALRREERDELFLIGLLSLFDVLFGMPMGRLLGHLSLSSAAQDVLLRSAGPYGPYLMLALVLERGDVERGESIANGLGIDSATLAEVQAAAFDWTQESLRQG